MKVKNDSHNEFNKLEHDYTTYGIGGNIYYDNYELAYHTYTDIIMLRIFAENEMIKLENSGTQFINKLWDKIGIGAGKNRKEIIEECKGTILYLESMYGVLGG